MKNLRLFLPFLLIIGLLSFIVPHQSYSSDSYPVVDYLGVDKGVANLIIQIPETPDYYFTIPWSGTFFCKVDNDTGKFYCIDIFRLINKNPVPMIDTGQVKVHILYIILNYYPNKPYPYPGALPSLNREAAAIQLAIWHFSDSINVNTLQGSSNGDIKNRALQIIADANANWSTASFIKTVKIEPVAISDSLNIADTLRVKVTNTTGSPMSGVTVYLTSTAGTLSATSAVTGPDGYTPYITLQKSTEDSVATIKACARAPIGIGTLYTHLQNECNFQRLVIASVTWGNVCDRLIITWSTSGGGGGGIESSYKMAEMLFLRNILLRKGEAGNMLRNDKITSTYPLQTFIPATGPYNSIPIETTPFDILGISNATSAYAVD
ncbi:MAG: Cys-Gln thioester bond-forming surface protein, partial [Ignavibacteria bacterium]|nr:Cys-Gln thioester bond-forming surface protein [Ignavibacteria bacterium]